MFPPRSADRGPVRPEKYKKITKLIILMVVIWIINNNIVNDDTELG
jgi:hypothetical protein